MLVLLSVRARLPRRDSRRVVERVSESEGVRESPPTEGVVSLPRRRYSVLETFHPEQ